MQGGPRREIYDFCEEERVTERADPHLEAVLLGECLHILERVQVPRMLQSCPDANTMPGQSQHLTRAE